jgi:transposase-like protein
MTIDPEIREKIVNEYLNGKKISEIAKEYDISKQSVLNILKEREVYSPKSLREIIESSGLKIMQRSEEGDIEITSESLNKKLKEMEEELRENREMIEILTNEKEDLSLENEDLKKKLNSLKKENEDLTRQINFLDEEKKKLENQAISLREENSKLNSKIINLTLENTRLIKEKNDLYSSDKKKWGRIRELERYSEIEIIIIFILLFLLIIFRVFNI